MVAKSKVLTFLEAAITCFYACDTMGLVPGTEDPMEKYWGISGLYGSFAPTKHTLDFAGLGLLSIGIGQFLIATSYSEKACNRYCLLMAMVHLFFLGFLIGVDSEDKYKGGFVKSEYILSWGIQLVLLYANFIASRGEYAKPGMGIKASVDVVDILTHILCVVTATQVMLFRTGPEETWTVKGSIFGGDPKGHTHAIQFYAIVQILVGIQALFFFQYSEAKHTLSRALLTLLTAGMYLHRMYSIKESGVMVEKKVNLYIGTELIFLVLALPSLFSKGKPKAA